jgi:hypothetical protein
MPPASAWSSARRPTALAATDRLLLSKRATQLAHSADAGAAAKSSERFISKTSFERARLEDLPDRRNS